MKFTLTMTDETGLEIGTRTFDWHFDGIGKDAPGKLECLEEYQAGKRATELYRDAALSVGKWPKRTMA